MAIVEGKTVRGLQLRYSERVALGTPYPEVVEHENLRGRCAVVLDSTGVGEPVVDMLRSAGLGAR